MAAKTEQQQVNALMTRYLNGYKERWGAKPDFNRFRYKWGFQDMLTDLGYERAQEIIDYFFGLQRAEHGVYTLLNNYERYSRIVDERAADRENRHKLREQTARAVKEWEEHGDSRGRSS